MLWFDVFRKPCSEIHTVMFAVRVRFEMHCPVVCFVLKCVTFEHPVCILFFVVLCQMLGSLSLNPYSVKNTVVTHTCSTCLSVAPSFVHRAYLFCFVTFLTTKSDYSPIQHYPIYVYNGMMLVVCEVVAEISCCCCHVNIH